MPSRQLSADLKRAHRKRLDIEDPLPPIAGGGGGIAGITVQEEGVTVGTPAGITTINYVGAGATATGAGAVATITIPGGGIGTNLGLIMAIHHGWAYP